MSRFFLCNTFSLAYLCTARCIFLPFPTHLFVLYLLFYSSCCCGTVLSLPPFFDIWEGCDYFPLFCFTLTLKLQIVKVSGTKSPFGQVALQTFFTILTSGKMHPAGSEAQTYAEGIPGPGTVLPRSAFLCHSNPLATQLPWPRQPLWSFSSLSHLNPMATQPHGPPQQPRWPPQHLWPLNSHGHTNTYGLSTAWATSAPLATPTPWLLTCIGHPNLIGHSNLPRPHNSMANPTPQAPQALRTGRNSIPSPPYIPPAQLLPLRAKHWLTAILIAPSHSCGFRVGGASE